MKCYPFLALLATATNNFRPKCNVKMLLQNYKVGRTWLLAIDQVTCTFKTSIDMGTEAKGLFTSYVFNFYNLLPLVAICNCPPSSYS